MSEHRGIDFEDKFLKRLFLTVGVVAGVVILILIVIHTIDALLIAFTGLLFAIILRGLTELITERTPWPDKIALMLVLVTLLLLVGIGLWLVTPPLIEQSEDFQKRIPEAGEDIEKELQKTEWGRRALERIPRGKELEEMLFSSGQGGAFSSITGLFSSTLGIIANIIVIIFLGLFFAFEPDIYTRNFLRLIPPANRERAREVLAATYDILKKWLFSRALSMIIIGTGTFIGLLILGTPLALTLSLINGVLAFIPTFGPIAATIPAALVGLTVSPTHALYVVIFYTLLQQGENYLITPFVERITIEIPHGIILVAQLMLGILIGFIGLALAPPLVAAAVVIIRMLYVEDVLGDKVEEKEK